MAGSKLQGQGRYSDRDDGVYKALANHDRRTILDLIRDDPRTTSDICARLGHLDRCTVMLHLAVLEQAELIMTRKLGRCRWNYLNVEPIQRVYSRWIRRYAQPAAELLTRLKSQLESR